MADIDNGDVIRATARMSIHGATLMNVFDFEAQTDGDGENAGAGITAVQFYLQELYKVLVPSMSNQVQFLDINAYNRSQQSDLGVFNWQQSGWPGFDAGDPLPSGVAALITLPTLAGRTRGRKFFPGFTEASTSGGRFTAGTLTGLGLAAAILLTTVGPVSGQVGLNYVVVSEGVGSFLHRYPISANVNAIPAYQRRRKEGVGI